MKLIGLSKLKAMPAIGEEIVIQVRDGLTMRGCIAETKKISENKYEVNVAIKPIEEPTERFTDKEVA